MFCSQCATPLTTNDVYCPQCAKPIASFAFETKTVAQVEPLETPTVVRPKTSPREPISTRRSRLLTIASIVILAIFAGIGFFSLLSYFFGRTQPYIATNSKEVQSPTPSPQTPEKTFSPTVSPTANPVNASAINSMSDVSNTATNTAATNKYGHANANANKEPTIRTSGPVQVGTRVIFERDSVDIGDSGRIAAWQSFEVGPNGGVVIGHLEGQGGIRGEFECFITNDDGLTSLRNGTSALAYYNSGRVVVAKINQSLSPGLYYLVFRNQSPWTRRRIAGRVFLKDN